jgi:uncharacterized membrane protein
MLAAAVTFDQVILALHIMAVVIAFGVVFTYPLFMVVGARLDPASMAWFHRMQRTVSRVIVNPGLLLAVVFGVILASEFHAWHAFYVQWGIGAAIVIGGIEGVFMIPRTGRLAELARRDVEPGGPGTERVGALSAEYRAVHRQVVAGSLLVSLIVLVTIFLMAIHAGA